MDERLVVLHEDAHCLAAAKPAGMLTQGRPDGVATLESMVRRHLRADDPDSVYLGTVHRLDRPVSGVVLWAKTRKAARRLAEQFQRREVEKEYWAVVEVRDEGRSDSAPIEVETHWEDWLGPVDAETGRAEVVPPGTPGARMAFTRCLVGDALRLPEGTRWLRLLPRTGRTHQLRAQAGSRGLPIRGDRAYGSTAPFPKGIALHARLLRVEHPILRRPLTIEADPPGEWAAAGIVLTAAPPRSGRADLDDL